jgi:hypothetical protein
VFNVTFEQAKRLFEEEYKSLYLSRVDYWAGQQEWAGFIDMLVKNGLANEKIVSKWNNPFPYGKRLKPKKWMKEERR